ncbi:MAG: ribonuclease P protein component [Panacagrimonas sp.]
MSGFPRSARLLRPADFKRVLEGGKRRRSTSFTGIERKSVVGGEARLGITASKKALRRSIDRNRFKRIVRESFRLAQGLPACDVVIMATPAARSTDRLVLAAELRDYWIRLRDRWPPSSFSSSVAISDS